jgi:hypothetical protein
MTKNPIVLVHGYSDKGESFKPWKKVLVDNGYQVEDVSICSYESLTNEVTIKDLAEGFDRALRIQAGLKNAEKFDAIVHSTGMLVIRSWLTTYNQRRERLNRLIGLAPASFGSPLADMGRSFLGSIFKGRKEPGPDFLEAGDKILDGLELGSRFTWELAHLDLLPTPDKPNDTFYGKNESTPVRFHILRDGALPRFVATDGGEQTRHRRHGALGGVLTAHAQNHCGPDPRPGALRFRKTLFGIARNQYRHSAGTGLRLKSRHDTEPTHRRAQEDGASSIGGFERG